MAKKVIQSDFIPTVTDDFKWTMIKIQVQTLFGQWVPYQTKSNERDAYRVASNRADVTGKRHRLVDSDGRVIDIIG